MKTITRKNWGTSPGCKVTLRDCTQMTWQDPSYCANCYEHISFSDSKLSFKDDLISDQTEPSIPKITLMEALDIVFDIYKKSHKTCIIFDDAYFLCQNCSLIFRNLFSLISQFSDASSAPSFLFSLIGSQRVQSKVVPLVQIKEEISDLDTFPPSVESFWDETDEPELENLAPVIVHKKEDILKKAKAKKIPKRLRINHSVLVEDEDYRRKTSKRKVPRINYSLLEAESEEDKETEEIPLKRMKQSDGDFEAFDDNYSPNSVEPFSEEEVSRNDNVKKENQTIARSSGSKPRARTHICTDCNIGFTRSNHLQRHLQQHKSKNFTCECGVGFVKERNLKSHKKENCKLIPNNSRVLSPSQVSSAIERKLMGVKRSHAAKLVKKARTRNKTVLRTFKCGHNKCGKVFPRLYKLNRHKLVHETKPFTCEFCHFSFRDEDTLERHVSGTCRVRNKSDIFVEKREKPKSSKKVPRETNALKNKRRPRPRMYACHCGETFSRTNHLRTHAEVHKEKNVSCTVCFAGFITQARLDKHAKIHDPSHVPADPENIRSFVNADGEIIKAAVRPKKQPVFSEDLIPCSVCGKEILQKNMKGHMVSHQGERPSVCELCGMAFKTIYSLRSHQKYVHNADRPYLCNRCGRAFKRSQHLVDHELVAHSEERTFSCKECGKSFKSKRNLRQHLNLHVGNKYTCEVCGNVFTRKDNLKVHQERNCVGTPADMKKVARRRRNRVRNNKGSEGQFALTVCDNLGEPSPLENTGDQLVDGMWMDPPLAQAHIMHAKMRPSALATYVQEYNPGIAFSSEST